MPRFRNHSQKEIETAKKWFGSLKEILKKDHQISSDIPFSLGRIKIALDVKETDAPNLKQEEIAKKYDLKTPEGQRDYGTDILSLMPGHYFRYAFVEMNEDSSYKNPMEDDDQILTWTQNNLTENLSDEQIAFLYDCARENRLYLESQVDDADSSQDARLIRIIGEDRAEAHVTDRMKNLLQNDDPNAASVNYHEKLSKRVLGEIDQRIHNVALAESIAALTKQEVLPNLNLQDCRKFINLSNQTVNAVKSIRVLSVYGEKNPEWFSDPKQVSELSNELQASHFPSAYSNHFEDEYRQKGIFSGNRIFLYKILSDLFKPDSLGDVLDKKLAADLSGAPITGENSLDFLRNLISVLTADKGFTYNGTHYYLSGTGFTHSVETKKVSQYLASLFDEFEIISEKLPENDSLRQNAHLFDNLNKIFKSSAKMAENQTAMRADLFSTQLNDLCYRSFGEIRILSEKKENGTISPLEQDKLDLLNKYHLLNKAVDQLDFSQLDKMMEEKRALVEAAKEQNARFMKDAAIRFNKAVAGQKTANTKSQRNEVNNTFRQSFAQIIAGKLLADHMNAKNITVSRDVLSKVPNSTLRPYRSAEIYDTLTEIILRSDSLNTVLAEMVNNPHYFSFFKEDQQLIGNGGILAPGGEIGIAYAIKRFNEIQAEEKLEFDSILTDQSSMDAQLVNMLPQNSMKDLLQTIAGIPEEDTTTVGRTWMERALMKINALLKEMEKQGLLPQQRREIYKPILKEYRNSVRDARNNLTFPDYKKLADITGRLITQTRSDAQSADLDGKAKLYLRVLADTMETGRRELNGAEPSKLTERQAFNNMLERLEGTSRGLFHIDSHPSPEMQAVLNALDQVMAFLPDKDAPNALPKNITGNKLSACRELENACRKYLDPASKKAENERKDIVRDILVQTTAILGRSGEALDSRTAIGKLLNSILTKPVKDQKKYRAVADSLKKLDNQMDRFYLPGNDGRLPDFQEKDRMELLALYAETAVNINSFFESSGDTKSDIYQMVDRASVLMEQDMDHLGSIRIGENQKETLPKIIEDARIKTISVDLGQVKVIGAHSSQRFPLSVDGVNGVFTKEEHVDALSAFDHAIKEEIIPGIDQSNQELESMCHLSHAMDAFKNIFTDEKGTPGAEAFLRHWLAQCRKIAEAKGNHGQIMYPIHRNVDNKITNGFRTLTISPDITTREILDLFIESCFSDSRTGLDPEKALMQFTFASNPVYYSTARDNTDFDELTMQYLWTEAPQLSGIVLSEIKKNGANKFIDTFGSKAFSHKVAQNQLNLKDNDRLDSRNSAMSAVASLLGVPNLLAKSVPIKLETPSGTINGTFMEAAKGLDPSHPDTTTAKIISEARKTGKCSLNPQALKGTADLQVLDYLCGNVDRHGFNLFYQFDEMSIANGKPIVTGIVGIDNDASFGTYLPKDKKGINRMVGIENMYAISESMAKKLMKLSPDLLAFALRSHNLSSQSIRAAKIRLNRLQTVIHESKLYYQKPEIQKKFAKTPNNKDYDFSYVEHGYLRIVKDNEWSLISPERLAFDGGKKGISESNLFNTVKKMSIEEKAPRNNKKLEFTKAEVKRPEPPVL